jgi:hypothetical protein
MHILSISSEKDADKLVKILKPGNDVFVLIYMEGCGPCNATRPEWKKLSSALKEQYSKQNNLYVVDINKDYVSSIKKLGSIDGFPTMRYYGKETESYEDSSVKKKDRSVDSFVNWIESHVNNVKVGGGSHFSARSVYDRLLKSRTARHRPKSRTARTRRRHRGGKWSLKYKRSINCRRPKGFSQRQYCKY